MDRAKTEERRLKHFFGSLKFYERGSHSKGESGDREASLLAGVTSCEEAIGVAFRDNFNTPKVIDVISRLVTECYATYEALPEAHLEPVRKVAELVERIMGVVGVNGLTSRKDNEGLWFSALDAFSSLRQTMRQLAKSKAAAADVIAAVDSSETAIVDAERAGLADCARLFRTFVEDIKSLASGDKFHNNLLKRCDDVRDRDFVELGVRLEDKVDSFIWMFEDRAVMEREQKEQAAKVAAAGREKLVRKLEMKQQELKAAEKSSVKPADFFSTGVNAGVYAGFDEQGIPTKLASGEDLSSKKKKDISKDIQKHTKEYEKLQKQAGAQGVDSLLAKLRSEVAELERQVGE
jgi:cysteinyl-tRNA synthetase